MAQDSWSDVEDVGSGIALSLPEEDQRGKNVIGEYYNQISSYTYVVFSYSRNM